jgi:hypothetical protein
MLLNRVNGKCQINVNSKGVDMNRIIKAVIFGAAVIMIAGVFTGCKKSVPGPDSQRAAKRQEVKRPEPKVVGPRITEPTEADIAEMERALAESDFQRGFMLKAAGEFIDVKVGHLVPHVVDWNNDGKKDMVMGQFSGGAITLFENIGTDEAPVFGEGQKLYAGGKPIKLDAG